MVVSLRTTAASLMVTFRLPSEDNGSVQGLSDHVSMPVHDVADGSSIGIAMCHIAVFDEPPMSLFGTFSPVPSLAENNRFWVNFGRLVSALESVPI
jgi:hypothetical protein